MATASSESLPAAVSVGTRKNRTSRKPDRAGWALIAPFFAVYILFLLWPVIGALWSRKFL